MVEHEPVTTFGEMTERWWMLFMLLADLCMEIYRSVAGFLASLFADDLYAAA